MNTTLLLLLLIPSWFYNRLILIFVIAESRVRPYCLCTISSTGRLYQWCGGFFSVTVYCEKRTTEMFSLLLFACVLLFFFFFAALVDYCIFVACENCLLRKLFTMQEFCDENLRQSDMIKVLLCLLLELQYLTAFFWSSKIQL